MKYKSISKNFLLSFALMLSWAFSGLVTLGIFVLLINDGAFYAVLSGGVIGAVLSSLMAEYIIKYLMKDEEFSLKNLKTFVSMKYPKILKEYYVLNMTLDGFNKIK